MQVLVLVRDLVFSQKVKGAAAAAQVETRSLRSVDALREKMAADIAQVIVDVQAFEAELDQIREVVGAFPGAKLRGFYPHVERELAVKAEGLGFEVMPRSKFVGNLVDVLRGE